MSRCSQCEQPIDLVANQVGRRSTCPQCHVDLRSCLQCRHFDAAAAKQCKEPFAEVPRERHVANFCEFFQFGADAAARSSSKDEALAAAEALFRKK